jgi:DNA (cytosine-5)-methyltransferase 1
MRVLDLFCGAGGITAGWQRAGTYVVGVDINPQPNYCGDEFYQADALEFPLDGFDVVVASPPCQRYSIINVNSLQNNLEHPDFLGVTRRRLRAWGGIYVIENVPGAPLIKPIMLCGSMFGLRVYRHRLFESNRALLQPGHAKHIVKCAPCSRIPNENEFWSIAGKFGGIQDAAAAMGIDWMITDREVSQAIPPVYAEFIARQVLGLPFWHLLAANRQMALL